MQPKLFCRILAVLLAAGGTQLASAQQQPAAPQQSQPGPAENRGPERSIGEWLARMHEASRRRAYVGTFVVSSSSGSMSSARIWHVCDGEKQIERVEALTGVPRSTFRRNDEVITFWPQAKVARQEKREALGQFPNLLHSSETAIPEFYTAKNIGSERVAGFDADVVKLQPRDGLRFGYRIWSEKKSGLVVKLQTVDTEGRIVEQAAFSELQLDAPVKMEKLVQMMASTEGYRVEKPELVKTTAAAEGWALKTPVAGFKPVNCYKRPGGSEKAMQWIFSDGLASVSLFVEPYDRQRHLQEALLSEGATQSLTRKIDDKGSQWWLTAVGEVPPQTLKAFASSLERRK